jgi:hypothetical protein
VHATAYTVESLATIASRPRGLFSASVSASCLDELAEFFDAGVAGHVACVVQQTVGPGAVITLPRKQIEDVGSLKRTGDCDHHEALDVIAFIKLWHWSARLPTLVLATNRGGIARRASCVARGTRIAGSRAVVVRPPDAVRKIQRSPQQRGHSSVIATTAGVARPVSTLLRRTALVIRNRVRQVRRDALRSFAACGGNCRSRRPVPHRLAVNVLQASRAHERRHLIKPPVGTSSISPSERPTRRRA